MSHFTKLPGHFLWLSTGLLATLLCVIACKEQKRTSTKQEAATIEVIDEEAIHSLGVNTGVLADMEKAISSGEYPNIHSVLILKGGKLIYERYFPGNDEHWGDDLGQVQNSRERLHDVRSISKSVVSTCIGLAIAQGKIKDVHQKVFDLLPEYSQYSTGPKSDLTLEHLLTMTSGFEWNEDLPYSDPENSEIKMTSSPDPIAYVLSRPLESDPGKAWKYNGGTTQLLAAILEKKTGRKVDEFAREYLFKPLGIEHSEWVYYPESEMPAAASGLRLTSRDLMKFGLLYARGGQWMGKRLLSENWVNEAMKSHIKFGSNNNVGYGYQFWVLDGQTISENQNHPIYAAIGNGDQRIYIDGVKQLLVVVTAGNYNQWTIKKDSEALLSDFIYPSFPD